MTTELGRALNDYQKRTVGSLNSWKIRTLPHGAKCTEDIDNFHLVELGFNEEGVRTASYLTDVTKKGYLIASPERRYMDEPMDAFFNGEGEYARIVFLDEGVRFETSAFTGEAKYGKVAHYDPTSKKFILHDGEHEEYANAVDKFLVVNSEDDLSYTQGHPTVRLEVL